MAADDKHDRERSSRGALRRVFSWPFGPRPRGVLTGSEEPSEVDLAGMVVVGCDGDRDSFGALRFAVQEAALRSASVLVVATYLHPIDPDVDEYDTPEAILADRAIAAAHRALGEALGSSPEGPGDCKVVAASGLTAHVLLTEFGQALLLVVGAHQRHLLSRLLHGPSTGGNLIQHAQTPVVVVPPDWQATGQAVVDGSP